MGPFREAVRIFQAKDEARVRKEVLEGMQCQLSCFPSCQMENVTFGNSCPGPRGEGSGRGWQSHPPGVDGTTPDSRGRERFNPLSFGVFML